MTPNLTGNQSLMVQITYGANDMQPESTHDYLDAEYFGEPQCAGEF